MRSLLALALLLPLAAPTQTPAAKFAQKPYMGWSTWSFLRSKPTEEKVKAQVDSLFAAHLPDYGYRYINLDAGWTDGYDDHGVPKPNLTTFPSGMDGFGQYLHSRGLLFGVYLNPGVDQKLYDLNPIIEGTTAHIHDITDTTQPGSTHKGSYRIDFTKPAARAYINSIVQQFARWKVDFVKLDFVGPGGGNLPADNREELRQWHAAIQRSKRPIWLELSNWLSIDQAPLWRATSNGWRIENDIECYPCGRSTDPAIKGNLTIWSKVSERFADVRPWIRYAGPAGNGGEGGWNDFDSLELGNGDKDGITPAERQTMFTLWAISCAPLYLGTDLTHMDSADLTIITNRNLIAINQAGIPATPLDIQSLRNQIQQAWITLNPDGSAVLSLFNLGPDTATLKFNWREIDALRDTHFAAHPPKLTDLITNEAVPTPPEEINVTLDSHASRIFRLTPTH
ncbi:alpha galactosidase A [Edaphobacter aggregans]|uniref:Alpha-galactosidase n=1 Tax=Edaphobacter aggregans TaxID=570835 RepID=A0A428MFW3_9BACT|nr:glycoside hydrolase family 27 protein [Edaphobacter aggregans]RSL15764.1 alpha galactosidase A [Edaphobacter aggregans]